MFFRSNKGEVQIIKEHSSNGDALSFIQYWLGKPSQLEVKTSGSTGDPKTIILKKTQITSSVGSSVMHFKWNKNDLFVCNLNINSIAGKMMLVRAVELQAALLFIPPNSQPLAQLAAQKQLLDQYAKKLVLAFVPLQLASTFQNLNHIDILNSAKTILIGGAPVSNTLFEKLKELSSPVYATYGMTETVTHIATRRLNGRKPKTYFEVLPNVSIQLSSELCLMIKAPQTKHQWITTNDLVKITDTSQFEFIGRKDNIINSGGVKIQLEKIEKSIESVTKETFAFFAFGMKDEKLGQALSIAFIPTKNATKIFNKGFMKEVFPKFEVPKYYFPVDRFELTDSGKIDKIKTIDVLIRDQVSN